MDSGASTRCLAWNQIDYQLLTGNNLPKFVIIHFSRTLVITGPTCSYASDPNDTSAMAEQPIADIYFIYLFYLFILYYSFIHHIAM